MFTTMPNLRMRFLATDKAKESRKKKLSLTSVMNKEDHNIPYWTIK